MSGPLHPDGQAGLYIHAPFCRKRCPFCDFAISTDLSRAGAWERALLLEIDGWKGNWDHPFDTVYFGGGTPSLLEPGSIARIIERLREAFSIQTGAEMTLEANPGTLGEDGFAALRRLGFNRISLGAQSFDDQDLQLLGRDHTVSETRLAIESARGAGFENLSIDLIYGLPGRSLAHWEAQMGEALTFRPEHVSAYMLTYEPGTPFTRMKERGELREPGDGEAADLFLRTREVLEAAGYRQYEVSSFARSEELESRHNAKYWSGAPYLGLGPSAHSFRGAERFWNIPGVQRYIEEIEGGRSPVAGRETLGEEERRLERLFLGLRTARGIDLDAMEAGSGEGAGAGDGARERQAVIDDLIGNGLAIQEGRQLRLTARGLPVADGIAVKLARFSTSAARRL